MVMLRDYEQTLHIATGACARDTHLSGDTGNGTCLAPLREPPTAPDAPGRIRVGRSSCAPAAWGLSVLRCDADTVPVGIGCEEGQPEPRIMRLAQDRPPAG